MQRRLLHGRDDEPPVRAHRHVEMGALPLQSLRLALRVRKPEREAVVVGDGETQAFRGEGQPPDGRRHLERALRALGGAHARLPTRRPRERAGGAHRHVVDPALLGIGGENGAFPLGVGRHHLAVVAAGHDTLRISGRGEDGAVVHGDVAYLARARHQGDRPLAEHEGRGFPEKMRGHHRRAGLDRPRALDDGRGVGAAIGHLGSISLVSRASAASAFARAEREPGPSARIAKRHINWNKDPSRGPGSRLFARAPHSLGRDTRGTVTPRSRQSLP